MSIYRKLKILRLFFKTTYRPTVFLHFELSNLFLNPKLHVSFCVQLIENVERKYFYQ